MNTTASSPHASDAHPPHPSGHRSRGQLLVRLGIVLGLLCLVLAGPLQRADATLIGTESAVVTPSTDIEPGRILEVTYSGFTGASRVLVRQCRADVTAIDQCGTAVTISTPTGGAGTARFALHLGRVWTPTGEFTCDGSTPCSISVSDVNVPTRFLTLPVSFRSGLTAPSTTALTIPPPLPADAFCPPALGDLFKAVGANSADQALRGWAQKVCQDAGGAIPLDITTNNSPEGRFALIESVGQTDSVLRQADFAMTGTGFTPEDDPHLEEKGVTRDDFVFIPLLAGSLVFQGRWPMDNSGTSEFLKNVYLTPELAAGIYSGSIRDPNDPRMTAANATNPDFGLRPNISARRIGYTIARAERSASTAALISWFQSTPEALAAWTAGGTAFTDEPTDVMPSSIANRLVAGAYQVASLGRNTPEGNVTDAIFSAMDRSIAVVPDLSTFGLQNNPTTLTPDRMTQVWLQNPDGKFVAPTDDAVRRGLAQMRDLGDGTYERRLTKAAGWNDPAGYVLPVVTYALFPKVLTPQQYEWAQKFVTWAITEGQKPGNLAPGYVALPDRMVTKATEQLAKLTTTEEEPPPGPPPSEPEDPFTDEGLDFTDDFGSFTDDFGNFTSDFGGGFANDIGGGFDAGFETATPGGETTPAGDAELDGGAIIAKPILSLLPGASAVAPLSVGVLALVCLISGTIMQRRAMKAAA